MRWVLLNVFLGIVIASQVTAGESDSAPPGNIPAAKVAATASIEETNETSPSTSQRISQPEVRTHLDPNHGEQNRRDPFLPSAESVVPSSAADGLVDAGGSEIPTGIRILGILRIKNKVPIAIIAVPGCPDPFFVREKDVVRIEATTATRSPSRATLASHSQETTQNPPPQLLQKNPALRQSKDHPTPVSVHAHSVTTNRQQGSVLYLYISKIDGMTVEAFPKARPDDKQIFR